MKSEIKIDKPATVYPCLKKFSDGAVVLFSEKKIGICVRAGNNTKLGEYRTDWLEDNGVLLPENEKIALSN